MFETRNEIVTLRLQQIWKAVLTGVLLLGISISVLVSAEFALRLAFPAKIDVTTEFHSNLLFFPKPNIEDTFRRSEANGGDIITWKTNGQSFRGYELRTNADIRLVVYGDSNIQAGFSHLENTFPARLESYLNGFSDIDIEVINAGVPGYGPDQSLIRLSLDSDTLQPDIVVFHVFADNDFGDILRNRLFDIEENRLLDRTDALIQFEELEQRNLKSFASSLLLVRAINKVMKNLVERELDTEQKRKEHYISGLLDATEKEYAAYIQGGPLLIADHYDIDLALYPNSASSLMKVALLEGVLSEAQRVADSKGIQLLVLIQPSVVDLTRNFAFLDYSFLSTYPSYDRERLATIVEDICVLREIHYLNLFPVFLENQPDNLFFLETDNHWNDAGQNLAARETAQYIYENLMGK